MPVKIFIVRWPDGTTCGWLTKAAALKQLANAPDGQGVLLEGECPTPDDLASGKYEVIENVKEVE